MTDANDEADEGGAPLNGKKIIDFGKWRLQHTAYESSLYGKTTNEPHDSHHDYLN